ncbi:extracellular solute-binding protein [Chelatococcus asaccharovorans]|uniref:Iron(III) transport system substrate-binding protein n=1 Tax=Chelatococcus asaccharovorans TaxID=28210 RepID=A0A2V3UUZ0_9HYPH|nr:extracellular solute-binding protein [Chelatococcus asaccharovorans]MBS7701746.1 extracellular solute-binding protein [Chelatococcus asaccharovorans]PXW64548.1 iron(III) transport system substrate-binding protein [Chelatococcus asaccharovorans]
MSVKSVLATLMLVAIPFVVNAKPLTIYSPQGGDERGTFIAQKAKEAGLDVQFLGGGGGELFDRLVAEKSNPQADLVLGLTQPSMYALKAQGMFATFVPTWAAALGPDFKDADGDFHMFWQTPIVLAYKTDGMTGIQVPKSWLDLAKPEYKDKFTVGAINGQTTRMILAGLLWRFTDPKTGEISKEGWDLLKAVYANSRVLPEGTDYWKTVASGQMPVILSWYGGVVNNAAKNKIPISFVDTEGGTPIVAESVGIIKGTHELEQAKKFVEWFGTPAFMAEYAVRFNQAPAHPEALAKAPEAIRAGVSQFHPQPIDWAVAASKLNGWLENIQLNIMP